MQGTVLTYDADGSGSVVLDDGTELPFAAASLSGTGLRHLRPGQRVSLAVTGPADSLRVERVQILTLR